MRDLVRPPCRKGHLRPTHSCLLLVVERLWRNGHLPLYHVQPRHDRRDVDVQLVRLLPDLRQSGLDTRLSASSSTLISLHLTKSVA